MKKTEIRQCGCGCGKSKEVPINSSWKYFKGHNLRVYNPSRDSMDVRNKIRKANTGKKRSLESRRKQSHTMKHSKVFKEAMKRRELPVACRKGKKISKQGLENMRAAAKNRKVTKEGIEARRQGLLRHFANPANRLRRAQQISETLHNNYPFNVGYVDLPNLEISAFHRSSYEKDALLLLDSKSHVIDIKIGKIHIPYFDPKRKIQRIYTPDFLVTLDNGYKLLIEVKPETFVNHITNQAKFSAAIKWAKNRCIDFCIWTESILYNDSSTTTSLQEIVEATVANSSELKV